MTGLKVAVVSDWFPPKLGGVETFVHSFSCELASRKGIEVEVITENYPKTFTFSDRLEVINGLRVRRLAGVIVPRWKIYFHPETPLKLKELFKKEDYDVVHTHHLLTPLSILATGVAKFMHPKRRCVITTNHTYHGWAEKKFFGFFGRFTVRSTQPDRVIVATEISRKFVERMGVNPEIIRKIPLGVDTKKFSPDKKSEELRKELGIGSNVFLLYAGRLAERKGVAYLLQAFREALQIMKEMKLVILGDGPLRNQLMELSRKLDLKDSVKFVGYRPSEEVSRYFASCDFMVAPSISAESFGLVMAEAMASGKPIIATDVSGFNEVFVEGTGFLVPPRDTNSLKERILQLATDRELITRMGRKAREEAVRRYSLERVVDSTLEVYNEVLSAV